MPLKVLVIQSAGFIGKSTVTASLLYPRLGEDVEVLSIEDANEDAGEIGIPVRRFLGSEFGAVNQRVKLASGSVIVDCGSSEYPSFIQGFAALPGSINAFHAVVVTMTPNERAQREAGSTIETLKSVGLKMDRLRILFNQVDVSRLGIKIERAVESQFVDFLTYADVNGVKVSTDAALLYAKVHMELASMNLSLSKMLADETDYEALLDQAVLQSRSHTEALPLVRMHHLQLSARGVQANMDAAFKALRLPVLETV